MKKILSLLFLSLLFISGCGDDPVSPPPTGTIIISVKSMIDTANVVNSNVILFNADNGESVLRLLTGSDGRGRFDVAPGNYYVRIAAQGFKESPQGIVNPAPFSVTGGQTNARTYYLDTLSGGLGKIDGNVNPAVKDVLISASSLTISTTTFHTYTGPDGYFIMYNIPFDTYVLAAVKSGYLNSDTAQVTISSGSPSINVQLNISQITGAGLTGKVTFLAANNGIVDVSLLDKKSNSVVTGLTTIIDASRNYSIQNIPDGEYLAWASFKNDGFVMDPDWLFKNPGVLNLLINNDTVKSLDFSVTDAIPLVSPTNTWDEVIPVIADSVIPLFTWSAYPQAKEYIIEVRDINGNLMWGGFDASGIIGHAVISKDLDKIRYNFDGTAAPLVPGEIYQWRIYADDDTAPNVQTLLSGSEDLMGLFIVP